MSSLDSESIAIEKLPPSSKWSAELRSVYMSIDLFRVNALSPNLISLQYLEDSHLATTLEVDGSLEIV